MIGAVAEEVPSSSSLLLTFGLGDLNDNALAKNDGALVKTHRSDFKLRSTHLELFPLLLPSPVRYPCLELLYLGNTIKLLVRCNFRFINSFLTAKGSFKVNQSVFSPG